MPEPNQRVLVVYRVGACGCLLKVGVGRYRGRWFLPGGAHEATHWQPLPDPPAKGEG
jgi:hypothetical protein